VCRLQDSTTRSMSSAAAARRAKCSPPEQWHMRRTSHGLWILRQRPPGALLRCEGLEEDRERPEHSEQRQYHEDDRGRAQEPVALP
jgi:hypothetical protein